MHDRMETIIGCILRIGVIAAATLVFVGGAIYFATHASQTANYHTFVPGTVYAGSVTEIMTNAIEGNSIAMIQLGLLLLIATPVVRVIFSLVAFAAQRDMTYTAITLVVLLVLLYSLLGHGASGFQKL